PAVPYWCVMTSTGWPARFLARRWAARRGHCGALPRGCRGARRGRWCAAGRYGELLPVRRAEDVVSLGEVMTPLLPLPRIAARLAKGGEVLVKDEGRLPTGPVQAGGACLAGVSAITQSR